MRNSGEQNIFGENKFKALRVGCYDSLEEPRLLYGLQNRKKKSEKRSQKLRSD